MALLPGERTALHIFEPRYRQLVADCVLEERPFVFVLSDDNEIARIGCMARVDRLIRRFNDGRLNVEVVGIAPVQILEETGTSRYFAATVAALEDDPTPADDGLVEAAIRGYRDLVKQVTGAPGDPPNIDGIPLSYAIAGAIEFSPRAKQTLLELREEGPRLAMLIDLIAGARAALDRQRIAAERASRNGKVIA